MDYSNLVPKAFIIIILLISVVAVILYCLTLFKMLKRIPKEYHQFPAWFVWLFLVPLVGVIFQWIMLPFGIPNTLKKYFANNQEALTKAKILFRIGLAQVIILTISAGALPPYDRAAGFVSVALWILYWVKCVRFRKQFLDSKNTETR